MPKPYVQRPAPSRESIERLRQALLARLKANGDVASWFGEQCGCEWLGGDADADNNSIGQPWVYRLSMPDISDTDKVWIIDNAAPDVGLTAGFAVLAQLVREGR